MRGYEAFTSAGNINAPMATIVMPEAPVKAVKGSAKAVAAAQPTPAPVAAVKGKAKAGKKPAVAAIHHIEITHPSPLLENRLTIVRRSGGRW